MFSLLVIPFTLFALSLLEFEAVLEDLGTANFASTFLPSIVCICTSRTSLAEFASIKVTKPKPRERNVDGSRKTTAEATFPYDSKYRVRDASVVSYDNPPINNLALPFPLAAETTSMLSDLEVAIYLFYFTKNIIFKINGILFCFMFYFTSFRAKDNKHP
mmetsp:Transcript_10036/g.11568  ORF Transcript_10036/g.11568 Transcript_10036/m.11568 type:complete len:160 (-) Transcript_10036:384-863(-)